MYHLFTLLALSNDACTIYALLPKAFSLVHGVGLVLVSFSGIIPFVCGVDLLLRSKLSVLTCFDDLMHTQPS